MSTGDVLIIGAGVSGLSCGIRLLEEGYGARIVAFELPPNITSNVAAAYWFPYKVAPKDKALGWATVSYNKFLELSKNPKTGVSMIELLKVFDRNVEDPFWKVAVRSFRRVESGRVPGDFIDGFLAEVPLIETPIYMNYLLDMFAGLGGTLEKLEGKIESLESLCAQNRVIVNCTGLGAGELCEDKDVFPIRGQIIRTSNPGLNVCISEEDTPTYIVPRSQDCVLGGTALEGDWDTVPDEETAHRIMVRCRALEPRLEGVRVLDHVVGLRPGRTEVRLEAETIGENCTAVHNYGHGGAGFTLSWGCAEDVLSLVNSSTV